MLKKHKTKDPQILSETEELLASFSIDDLPIEEEPSRVFEGLPETPESLASKLMGQVIYQINRRIRELDETDPHGMNRKELAKRMGVSKSQVTRLLGAQSNTTLLTIAKAALALDLTEAVLKLIPEEAAPHQEDEVKAFVQNIERWWPLTDRRSAEAREPSVLSLRQPDAETRVKMPANDYSYANAA